MTKITFIGAGSLGFTRELVRDILTFPLLTDATISLMDMNHYATIRFMRFNSPMKTCGMSQWATTSSAQSAWTKARAGTLKAEINLR